MAYRLTILLLVLWAGAAQAQLATSVEYARQHIFSADFDNLGGALGAPDGSVASGPALSEFYAFDFDFSGYQGIITGVRIGVLANNDDPSNIIQPFAMRMEYNFGTAPPDFRRTSVTYNHGDGYEWAVANIYPDEVTWTWNDVSSIRIYTGYNQGLTLDAEARYDAFRVEVDYIPPSPTPIPSATPTPTITPPPSPTPPPPTPTPGGEPTPTPIPPSQVRVLLGGYLGTSASASQGGSVRLMAWAEEDSGAEVDRVQIHYNSAPLNTLLPLVDRENGFFQLDIPFGPGLFPDFYLLELRAYSRNGLASDLWPYIDIDSAARQPSWRALYRQALAPRARPSDSPERPRVLLAGWMDSDLSPAAGGKLRIMAVVDDPQGLEDIADVRLLYQDTEIGVSLLDNGQQEDFGLRDGVYGLSLQIPPGEWSPDFAGRRLFQVQAEDRNGNQSLLWPYLYIE